jgi:hypothetical protein
VHVDEEASQTRDLCGAKSARHFARLAQVLRGAKPAGSG